MSEMTGKRKGSRLAFLATFFVGGLLVMVNHLDQLASHGSKGDPEQDAITDLKAGGNRFHNRPRHITEFELEDVGVLRGDGGNSVENKPSSVDVLFDELTSLQDPTEKRLLREEISDLKPASTTLKFLLAKLKLTEAEDQKTQIYSIITLMNGADIVDVVKELASRTEDEELFLSLVYSLRRAKTEKAKRALFELIVDNRLQPARTAQAAINNQGLVGLYRALMDTLTIDDASWINDRVGSHPLSDAQRLVLQEFINNHQELLRR